MLHTFDTFFQLDAQNSVGIPESEIPFFDLLNNNKVVLKHDARLRACGLKNKEKLFLIRKVQVKKDITASPTTRRTDSNFNFFFFIILQFLILKKNDADPLSSSANTAVANPNGHPPSTVLPITTTTTTTTTINNNNNNHTVVASAGSSAAPSGLRRHREESLNEDFDLSKLTNQHILYSQLVLTEKIGQGTFGKV
jgi:hypothetical protein